MRENSAVFAFRKDEFRASGGLEKPRPSDMPISAEPPGNPGLSKQGLCAVRDRRDGENRLSLIFSIIYIMRQRSVGVFAGGGGIGDIILVHPKARLEACSKGAFGGRFSGSFWDAQNRRKTRAILGARKPPKTVRKMHRARHAFSARKRRRNPARMRAISIAKDWRGYVRDDARCATLDARDDVDRAVARMCLRGTAWRAPDTLQNTVVIRRLDRRIHGTAYGSSRHCRAHRCAVPWTARSSRAVTTVWHGGSRAARTSAKSAQPHPRLDRVND
jgi:hypothetical protein